MIGAQIAIGMAAAGEAGGMPITGKGVEGEASSADALFFEQVLALTAGGGPKHWDLEIERPIDVDTADKPPVAPIAVPAAFVPVPQELWPPSPNSEAIALPSLGCAESIAAAAVTETIAANAVTESIAATAVTETIAANVPIANAPIAPLVDAREAAGNMPPPQALGGRSVVGEGREHTPPSNTGQVASGTVDAVTVDGGSSAGATDSPGDPGEHASSTQSDRFVTPNREAKAGADPAAAAAPPEMLTSSGAQATPSAVIQSLIQGTAHEDRPLVLEAGAQRAAARTTESAPIAPVQVRPAETVAVAAVAPARELSAPPDAVEGQDLFDQMVQAVRWQWNGLSGALRVRLHPEYLGAVSIDLQVRGGDVRAAVTADTPFVRHWIESHASELRAALSGQELVLSELVVHDQAQPKQRRPPPERRHVPARTRQGSPQETFSIVV